MESFYESSFLTGKSRKSYLSDMVTSFIPSTGPKGIQSIVFLTASILLSVSILFLLAQVYLIFLPCLKALLWALLCGSALYPFKANLNSSLQAWLSNLEQANRSISGGLILLPFQCLSRIYFLLIDFMSLNKFLFALFHFRFQICHALSILSGIVLTILGHNKGIITAFVIFCSSAQLFLVIFRSSHSISHVLSSFNFFPSILLLTIFYLLHCVGLIGHILFTIFAGISLIGFIITVHTSIHNPKLESVILVELSGLINILGDKLKENIQRWIGLLLGRVHFSTDSTDNSKPNLSQQYISVLFMIFLFVLVEQVQLSNAVLAIFCIHLATIKLFSKIFETFESFKQHVSDMKDLIINKMEKDIFFKLWINSFLKGDQLIRKFLQNSADLITSVGLILIVTVMVAVFSVILSIKVYGECYSAIYVLRNELTKIDYIRDSINLTLNEVTNVDYLNNLVKDNLLSTNKWNLKEEDKELINKMLIDFGENILVFLNASRNGQVLTGGTLDDSNQTQTLSSLLNQTEQSSFEGPHHLSIRSLVSHLSLVELKKFNFEVIFDFVNTRANSYMPLLKGFLSILYAFIFVILDGSSVVLGFILNLLIFTLALFYLLSSSRDKYKPIEFLDNIVASLFTNCEQNRFSRYVEEVVNSIFAATIKISTFYGIYTWLLHSLFDIQICFIPSVIAAILAAVPLLNAYWASLPACIYLYYFDPNLPLLKSLAMTIMAIMPSFIVDSSIYSDIKRAGHPYLTGLAITCGVVYYGAEGALFGPLWLCFLFIIIHMCTSLTSDNNLSNSLVTTPT